MHWLRLGWRRSPRSSAGRRLREIYGRTPIRLHSLPRSSGPGPQPSRSSSTNASPGRSTTFAARARPPSCRCSRRASSPRKRQLDELEAAGADAALLILRDLDDRRAAALMAHAATLGLDTLVEAHDADELARAGALGADPIGVNARDLVDVRDRPQRPARPRRTCAARPGRRGRERHPFAGPGRGGGARRRRRRADRARR